MQRLVYDFFYPGILGSIFYDILPLQQSQVFYTKLFIIVLLFLDYYHLYFIMEGKFSQKQKNTWWYIVSDFLVAICVFISFKYIEVSPKTAFYTLAFIPGCFLLYSLILKYNVGFYLVFAGIAWIVPYTLWYYDIFNPQYFNCWLLAYTSLLTVVYFLYILERTLQKSKK